MARPAEPGRTALLDAGARVLAAADSPGWTGLSANAVVAEAAMSKGAFFHHFPTRKEFVLELHARFHAGVAFVISEAISSMPPGPDRLRSGIAAYLGYCLSRADAKAFLFDARADGDLREQVAFTNRQFAAQMAPDLAVVGWSSPEETAHLAVATVAEVALIEKDLERTSLRHRSSLWKLLRLDESWRSGLP